MSLYLFLIINNSFEAEAFSSQSPSKCLTQLKSQLYSNLLLSNALLIESTSKGNKDKDLVVLNLKDIFTSIQLQDFLNQQSQACMNYLWHFRKQRDKFLLITEKVTEAQQQQNYLTQQIIDLNCANLRDLEVKISLGQMLETQIKLNKKIIKVKNYQAEICQLKLKLSVTLTEKQLQTLLLDLSIDFYNLFFWTLHLSEKISDSKKLSDKKSSTFKAWQLQMKLKLISNQDQYLITQKQKTLIICSLKSDALNYCLFRSLFTVINPFLLITDIIKYLATIYEDLNKV